MSLVHGSLASHWSSAAANRHNSPPSSRIALRPLLRPDKRRRPMGDDVPVADRSHGPDAEGQQVSTGDLIRYLHAAMTAPACHLGNTTRTFIRSSESLGRCGYQHRTDRHADTADAAHSHQRHNGERSRMINSTENATHAAKSPVFLSSIASLNTMATESRPHRQKKSCDRKKRVGVPKKTNTIGTKHQLRIATAEHQQHSKIRTIPKTYSQSNVPITNQNQRK